MAMQKEEVLTLLDEVKDPEIPVVSLVEMGILRAVEVDGVKVTVTLTPTFAGCPAMQMMQTEVRERLLAAGFETVEIKISNDPPWSSNWITEEARRKLQAFGIAPPPPIHSGELEIALSQAVSCPYCGSKNTHQKNSFGPGLCRSIYYCNDCQQPFEQFKPL